MWTRQQVKSKGLFRFKANYWKCVLVTLILGLISGGGAGSSYSSNSDSIKDLNQYGIDLDRLLPLVGIVLAAAFGIMLIAIALSVFVFNPLTIGCRRFFLVNLENEAQYREMKIGFEVNYWNVVKVTFLQNLFIFLWSLLFIIPGIIKAYEYRMIPYLLAENPNMTSEEAFAESKRLMTGNKWDTFVLDLSFIGWHLLAILTCGILEIFYVAPYVNMTDAALFQTLKYGTPSYYYNPNQEQYQDPNQNPNQGQF